MRIRFCDPRVSALLVSMCIALLLTVVFLVASRSPAYKLFTGFTKNDVLLALGKPDRIWTSTQTMGSYGAQPPAPPKRKQEVWVYATLMKLTFVYFDDRGRVRMVYFTST